MVMNIGMNTIQMTTKFTIRIMTSVKNGGNMMVMEK